MKNEIVKVVENCNGFIIGSIVGSSEMYIKLFVYACSQGVRVGKTVTVSKDAEIIVII